MLQIYQLLLTAIEIAESVKLQTYSYSIARFASHVNFFVALSGINVYYFTIY